MKITYEWKRDWSECLLYVEIDDKRRWLGSLGTNRAGMDYDIIEAVAMHICKAHEMAVRITELEGLAAGRLMANSALEADAIKKSDRIDELERLVDDLRGELAQSDRAADKQRIAELEAENKRLRKRLDTSKDRCGVCGKDVDMNKAVYDEECGYCCPEHYAEKGAER